MRCLVLGDPVVALDSDRELIEHGAVVVEDSKIAWAGPQDELPSRTGFDRVIGSDDHVVLPGLVNAHFHSAGFALRGLHAEPFERRNIHIHRSKLSEQDVYDLRLAGLLDCLRGGQTAVLDFSYGLPDMPNLGYEPLLQAYEDIGIRATLGVGSRDQNRYVHAADEEFLDMLPPDVAGAVLNSPMGYAWPIELVVESYRSLVSSWDGRDERIRVILAPDWTPACSDSLLETNRQLADEYDTGITMHVLETRWEMSHSLHSYGKTAMRRLADLGFLGPDVSCAHFVWATDEDIAILADTGAVAVNNPGSNLRLSTGIARVRDILDADGAVAIGTDSISFSGDEDFLQELRLASYLQRVPRSVSATRIPSERLLRCAVGNGARAIRQDQWVGALAPGMAADMVVIRKDRMCGPAGKFSDTPVIDIVVDRARASDIDTVLVAGRVVVERGAVVTVPEDRVWDRAAEILSRRIPPVEFADLVASVEPALLSFYERDRFALRHPPAYQYNVGAGPQTGLI